MASATKTAKARGGGEGGELLKGTHLPKNKNEVVVFVNNVREAPEEWGSPLVLDIDEVYGCTALALNKTNVKRIVEMIDDDYEKWPGYDITFTRVSVNNPSTKQSTMGLEATAAKKSKRKPVKSEIPF
jgi:hypothetical protein